jgi:pyruvyltransferase
MRIIKAQWVKGNNVGDTLTPIIVEHFIKCKVEWVERKFKGKLLAVGSIMRALRKGDTVWGAGVMRENDEFPMANLCKILAIRGKLSEKRLGCKCGVYGDPALLLPLMYSPKIKKTRELGYVPHYIDQDLFVGKKIVDVLKPWKEFVDDLLQYERIETSSLHGLIIALAYGVPAKWIKYSDRVIGDGFKFKDFGTGVGLEIKEDVWYQGIPNLKEIQDKLIESLKKL